MSARLYLVTPPAFEPDAFAATLGSVLDAAEVACVRLSLDAGEETIRRAATALRPVCAARDVALILGEHVRLAAELKLDGVHLGSGSGQAVRAAREALGPEAIVGAGAGTGRHRGLVAAEAGADYVSLGPVRSGTLGDGAEAGQDLFEWWAEMIETPCVAEGGLTPELARALAPYADFVAPRLSVWDAAEGPAEAARAYAAALEKTEPRVAAS